MGQQLASAAGARRALWAAAVCHRVAAKLPKTQGSAGGTLAWPYRDPARLVTLGVFRQGLPLSPHIDGAPDKGLSGRPAARGSVQAGVQACLCYRLLHHGRVWCQHLDHEG